MPTPKLMVDLDQVDFDHVIADIEQIRQVNRQRFEMEQLTSIVYDNIEDKTCVGYKDVGEDEFWIRGHMPDYPLMPGVIMCEAAAQLASYYTTKNDLMKLKENQFLGFGGMEEVRFRGQVLPGDRLVIIAKLERLRPGAMCICRFQAAVNNGLVAEGKIKGVALSLKSEMPTS
ncbi:Beta-hydroxyacyl-ACP dehydratase [Planctomycetales bacterium 10988]|nr:Beta-hydroxyacyl-ACP dehydratase [Planctomycetales bacterium 10988]